MKTSSRHPRPWRIAGLVAGILLAGSVTVLASHNFTDVPTGASYHNAVEWIVNRNVTAGCAPGLYCPTDPVTRAQMALFMNRLSLALTPEVMHAHATSTGALDIDSSPRICQTTDFTPTFPMQVAAIAWVSLRAGGPMNAIVSLQRSINSGVSWQDIDAASVAGASAVEEWASATDIHYSQLSPGTPVRFSISLSRHVGGTADATDGRCALTALLINANPSESPLSVPGKSQRRR